MRLVALPAIVGIVLMVPVDLAAADQPGAGAHVAGAGAQAPAPLYTEDDLRFLQHMIVHHQQALDMSALVPDRTDRDELRRFARSVERAQAAEIAEMRSLLEIAAERGLEPPRHGPHGDPPMDGMLSTAEMEALAAARGAEFERIWLEKMIDHHEGAIAMAGAQQRRQREQRRRPYGIDVLVEDILIEQRAEITQMRVWLREWGLADPP